VILAPGPLVIAEAVAARAEDKLMNTNKTSMPKTVIALKVIVAVLRCGQN